MYLPPDSKLWQGRDDGPESLRWHQLIKLVDLDKEPLPGQENALRKFAFLGFRSDEGVKRNKGRAGAANGPPEIRKAFANFAVHIDPASVLLVDTGDILCNDSDLDKAQEELAGRVSTLAQKGFFPLILGGGHEVSYAGYKGVFHTVPYLSDNPGILNFDAHFDLRSYADQASSGSPFLQIADLCAKHQKKFRYMCLGIQPQSNTADLFRKANALGVEYILADDMHENALISVEHALIGFCNRSPAVYLTIDMDVFDVCDAPGVSAPAVPGIDKQLIFILLKSLVRTGKVIACDFAETNPVFDIDGRTARLAAYLLFLIVNT